MIHDQGLCSVVSGQTNEFLGVNHTRVHVNVEGWTVGGFPRVSIGIFQGRAVSFLVCKYTQN